MALTLQIKLSHEAKKILLAKMRIKCVFKSFLVYPTECKVRIKIVVLKIKHKFKIVYVEI